MENAWRFTVSAALAGVLTGTMTPSFAPTRFDVDDFQ